MDFSAMDKAVYGNKNLEDDPELMAELLALEEEERQSRAPPPAAARAPQAPRQVANNFGIDPAIMAAALADEAVGDIDENDEDLLGELNDLVGEPSSSAKPVATPTPPPAPRAAPPPPAPPAHQPRPAAPTSTGISSSYLRELLKVYEKMKSDSEKENNAPKTRRLQRATDNLKDLVKKADRGQPIDKSQLPPEPPGWTPPAVSTTPIPPAAHVPTPTIPEVAKPAHHPPTNPVRSAAHTDPTPAIPPRKEAPPTASTPKSKKDQVMEILIRRKTAFVNNGKAAIAAHDKEAAKGFIDVSKMFEQAIAALESASVDDLDLSEIPATPPPYRKKVEPKTFLEHLDVRRQRYQDLVDAAKKEGNERKMRMYQRSVTVYSEAIQTAKANHPVEVSELPSLPDMPPLPPQGRAPAPTAQAGPKPPTGPVQGVKPPPSVGPLADSGPPGLSRNATQLQFLLLRQQQFKEAAIVAKNRGDIELAKKYLLNAKGFDKMIAASKNGLPVDIKDTPIPPQVSTAPTTLQPKIVSSSTSSTGVESRGEALSMLEKGLIEQIQLAENNRMKFTRLGDVGKVKLFEGWAKSSKQDLLLIREVAKQGLKLPKFRIENRQIPSADLFPDLAEDVIMLTVVQCRDVPLPSGYEAQHANIFVRYTFGYPVETPQSGKTRLISGTTSPEFEEAMMLQIGSKKARGSKLSRVLKRSPLKLEVIQKGSFLRSDKILGTCEWKLEDLEGKAEIEESLPLKEGRKAVGGLLSVRARVREPLGDVRLQVAHHKWIIFDA